MINKYKKENILLFIGIGILIVIFLYYNNFTLYKTTKYKEHFNNNTTELPYFIQSNNSDIASDIKKNELLVELYKFLIPFEDNNSDNTNINARYNVLSLFTKKYNEEIRLLNNKNNLYNVNINNLHNIKNSFVNNLIDLRENNTGEYAKLTYNNLINLGNGITINIEFLSNLTYPVKYNFPVRFIIEEKTYDSGNINNTSNIKKYETDNMKIEPINDKEFNLIFNIQNNNDKYPELNINNNTLLYHQIIIKLILLNDIYKITNNKPRFIDLLENINIYKSKLIYKIYTSNNYNSNNLVFEFESNFMINKIDTSKDLNEYTRQRLKDMHIETLNDNYNVIVSDMFNLDNKISKKEKIIKNIKNHYLLNELSNAQNNMKFYNTY